MRKTLVLAALLAATAFTPAFAQEEPEQIGRVEARVDRGNPRNEGFESRADRGVRPERIERVERSVEQQQPQRSENTNGSESQDRRGGEGAQGGIAQAGPAAPVFQPPVMQSQPTLPVAQPMERRMGVRGGMNNGGMNNEGGLQGGPRDDGEMRDPNRPNQSPRPNWDRGNAPSGQLGSSPVLPPVIADRTDGRGNDRRGNDERWNDGWRGDDRQWDRQGGRRGDRHYENRNPQRWGESRDWNGRGWNGGGWNGRGWNNRDVDGRAWNRDWRRDQRYDWKRWRYSNRDTFRARPYYAPYDWNYGYRRFSIGFSLTRILFDQRYWIQDPYSYRLPPAYGAYRWVRYYDDVLLVDVRTGQVVDAIYDFFW